MTNYIEIEHSYETESAELNTDVWYAVRPTPGSYIHKTELHPDYPDGWAIRGSNLHIHDKQDIAALRKLLNVIEAELDKEQSE